MKDKIKQWINTQRLLCENRIEQEQRNLEIFKERRNWHAIGKCEGEIFAYQFCESYLKDLEKILKHLQKTEHT